MRGKLLVLIVTLFSYFATGACLAQDTQKSIKIGVIQSLTGIAAEDGKTVVQALQLAADDINSQGKLKVELLIEDDGTQSKNTVTAFEKLSAQGIDAVVGGTWDFTTNAILAIAGRKRTVVFNTSTFGEALSLSDADGYGFINAVAAEDEAVAFERYLSEHKIKNMVIVFVNNSWGEAQIKVYKKIAAKFGVSIVDELRSTSYDANEWNIFVTRVKQKKSDLVLLLLNKNDLEIFLRKARELGLRSSFFASKNLFDALHSSSAKNLYNGACFTYPMEQLGKEADFRVRYKKRFGEDARIYADNTYDALFIITKAVAESRRRNTPLRDALREVKYDGLVGKYEFSETKSFSAGNSSLVCVHDGVAQLER